jgi:hypothetical protein
LQVIGSATEGALLLMIKSWGYDDKEVKGANYSKDTDKVRSPFIQRHTCTVCRFWNDHFQCPFTHKRAASCF